MTTVPSRRIAAVLGPTVVAVTMSEAINLGLDSWIWADVHPTVVYLNGLILLVGGLVIVTTHNIWVLDWRTLSVTASGWLLILGGLYRMLFPTAPQLKPGPAAHATIFLLGCLGLAVSWVAFLDGRGRTPRSHSS